MYFISKGTLTVVLSATLIVKVFTKAKNAIYSERNAPLVLLQDILGT